MGDWGVKNTKGKHTESTDLGSWAFTETELLTRELTWDWFGSSEHALQLCGLVFLWDSWQREQGLFLMLFPLLGTFPPAGFPYPALTGEEVTSFVATWYPMVDWYTWKVWTFLKGREREWMVARVRKDCGSDREERRKGRESVIGLGKINKLINKKCAYTSGIWFSTYWAILSQTSIQVQWPNLSQLTHHNIKSSNLWKIVN